MVSALGFGSSGPYSSPDGKHCVVPANLMLGVALRWTGIPSKGEGGGEVEIVLVASCGGAYSKGAFI